jgi:hypothetical protein
MFDAREFFGVNGLVAVITGGGTGISSTTYSHAAKNKNDLC